MNLEELRDVRRTERERDGLQSLPDSFYRDVASYLADLKAERASAAEAAADPFSDPEVGRLTEEIETAEEVVESIYERRVGKVVDRASFAAADMRHETEGLTAEERDLFDDLVARIERNRERVLDALEPEAEAGDDTGATADAPTASPTPDAPDGDAPDPSDLLSEAMGGSADGGTAADDDPATAEPTPEGTTDGGVPAAAADGPATQGVDGSDADATDPERRTVYVTRDVGDILGVDERTYRLAAEDVVDLPADNARALVERDAAEPLE